MNDEERSLVPLQERTVEFYGDELKGVIVMITPSEQRIYVPVRPICDFLGVAWSAQRRRILDDAVLSEELQAIQVTTAGGPQEMQCLPLDMLNGWLFGINARRVKDEVRDRLIRYQRECYRVLASAFQTVDAADPLAMVEQQGRALITLAREQREFNRRLSTTQEEVQDVRQRVVALEERVAPGQPVTDEQASQISQAVKAIAMALSRRTGRNEYGGVYGELYRKFGITSYKLLPADRFEEAMDFLREWHQSLVGEAPF